MKRKASKTPEQYRPKDIRGRISFARKRAALGIQYATETGAYELADMIKSLRRFPIIPQKSDSLTLDQHMRNLRAKTAYCLLKAATISTKSLRLIANALDAIDADRGANPSQDNIITAYEKAYESSGKRAPTFPELRDAFVAMFGEQSWRGSHREPSEPGSNYSVRKTVKALELPLSKATRGRPPGARSQIGNPRRVEQ